MGKRALSMNRTLAWMLMVGYTALLVLLLVISLYWISNTQYEVERAEDEALAGYVDRASDEMSMLERHIYDTYATNSWSQRAGSARWRCGRRSPGATRTAGSSAATTC